jgi:SAM-dependent methyltransferase
MLEISNGRRGQIDKVEDLASFDLVEFNGGVNPIRGGSIVERAFMVGAKFYRSQVEKWGFSELGAVADIGAGYGRWSLFLAEVNPSVHGFERVDESVELAKKLAAYFELANATFEVADVTALPASDNSYDGAWCFNVLQFVDRRKALTEIHRVLKPGGLMMLGAYNGLGRVLERFFQGYAAGGLADRNAQFALQSLKQGPEFHDSNGTYGSEEHIDAILAEFGFAPSPAHPVELRRSPKVADTSSFTKELENLSELAERLQGDPDFLAEFTKHPDLAYRYPLALSVGATKIAR